MFKFANKTLNFPKDLFTCVGTDAAVFNSSEKFNLYGT
jgi:hypothetical protein